MIEFWIKFGLFPSVNSDYGFLIGIIAVFAGQVSYVDSQLTTFILSSSDISRIFLYDKFIRSTAMITCGESFNHIIQHSKKDTHRLVTWGM